MVDLKEKGQTLIEVIVIITIGILVIGALVFATIASLRNAQFAKNQAQATKLAQEGIEKVRSIRDRDSTINTSMAITKFSELFGKDLSAVECKTVSDDKCYFRFDSFGVLSQVTNVDFEDVDVFKRFKRQILIGDQTASRADQKTITVVVQWTDFSGSHESRLTTILRKL